MIFTACGDLPTSAAEPVNERYCAGQGVAQVRFAGSRDISLNQSVTNFPNRGIYLT
jgi:hypothetical protein